MLGEFSWMFYLLFIIISAKIGISGVSAGNLDFFSPHFSYSIK